MTYWQIRRFQNVVQLDENWILRRHSLRQNLASVLDRSVSSPRCQGEIP